MIARRRCAKAATPRACTQVASPSGPRWRRRSFISSTVPCAFRSGLSERLTAPPIPHMARRIAAGLVRPVFGKATKTPPGTGILRPRSDVSQQTIDKSNAEFWDTLCGWGLAQQAGITGERDDDL